MQNLLLSGGKEMKKVNLASWKLCCTPKVEGGLDRWRLALKTLI